MAARSSPRSSNLRLKAVRLRPRGARGRPAIAPPAARTPAAAPAPDPGLDAKVAELTHVVEEYRGLRFERSVPRSSISNAQLEERIAAGLRAGAGPAAAEVRRLEISLQAFGLIPRTPSLSSYLPKLMGRQVARLYDPARQQLSLGTRPQHP